MLTKPRRSADQTLRRLASSIPVMAGTSIVWTIASLACSLWSAEWQWFQRSGAILGLCGALLAARAIVRLGAAGAAPSSNIEMAIVMGTTEDGRAMVKRSKEALQRERESKRDQHAAVAGVALAAIGTVISGYGDLLGAMFGR